MNIRETATSSVAAIGDAPDWIAYFAGDWRMTRAIEDRAGARAGTAIGTCVFSQMDEAAALFCAEALSVDYGGRRFPAEQQTVWRFDRGAPELYFFDGRLFCDMNLQRDGALWRAALIHRCGDDFYEGDVEIISADQWRIVWRANGPRKDYALDTTYVRQRP